MKLAKLIIKCLLPVIAVIPIFTYMACSASRAANVTNDGLNYVGQSVKDLPQNLEAAAPYLKKDLETTWNRLAGTMTVYGERVGISEPSHPLAMAEEAREKLISGESIEEVVAEAQKELTTEDLKEVSSSDLAALNGVLPFDIDLTKCGGNLAEVLNSLDVGQVSAILNRRRDII